MGLARWRHIACLALNGAPPGRTEGWTFWPDKMSRLELIEGYYAAILINPIDGGSRKVIDEVRASYWTDAEKEVEIIDAVHRQSSI